MVINGNIEGLRHLATTDPLLLDKACIETGGLETDVYAMLKENNQTESVIVDIQRADRRYSPFFESQSPATQKRAPDSEHDTKHQNKVRRTDHSNGQQR